MRYHEFMTITENQSANTLSGNLTKQADAKADQAKRMKQQAALAKKREQINGQRTKMIKTQSDLAVLMSKSDKG
ncbi:hypothetical protein [Paramagnetospirillum magnetotacticum]|nr:hypothetical protein [Paramagnetospirillum magnetotacticum]